MANRMENQIVQYLAAPNQNPRPQPDQDRHFMFLLNYLGELFIQGYRLVDRYGKVLVFSIMQYQMRDKISEKQQRVVESTPPFKVVLWQMDTQDIFFGEKRRGYYQQMLKIGKWLEQPEYHIIYLHPGRYSIVSKEGLQNNTLPTCMLYYKKIKWLEEKNGSKPIQQKQEGINLHALVELLVKGCGEARQPKRVKHLQGHEKYVYDLFKVVNTISYIIGKEMLQNDYQTITSEKWMRKATEKSFRRLDLVLRNQEKCCVLDWKFTRLEAKEKIKGNWITFKNKIYYQLALKDFKTSVELKFYCLHERVVTYNYHNFTCAAYNHNIEEVEIEESEDYPRAHDMSILLDSSIQEVDGFEDEPVSEESIVQLYESHVSHKERIKAEKALQREKELREAMEEVSGSGQHEQEEREPVIDLCSEDYIQVDSQPQ